ncbi:MATE family efflux transporter [Streptomyces libani]|uniref:Probable multidrug resistance protein NorM n=1 Tax=Streptomyces nigrescens TaxID=1920 RepID=A0A640TTF9_STRNI|nr:MATE family efflux transporter [Streptomyces libani]WAU00614.1 MATE family efflux transporter [Streptomyces libani subsp. libani]GFE26464.1 MATE family efflux transporter [Streptomyces libani subsp. libani]GGW07211.1 MATE family efflux transporter [Streptomyces libani subsp. libani]
MLTTLLRDSRALAALAVPLILTQLAQVALTTTDTVMMGLLGTEELAAGGLALVIFNQLRTMGVGLLTSVGNQIAAAAARLERTEDAAEPGEGGKTGEREAAHAEIRGIVRASMVLATLAGLAGAVLMLLIGQALIWLGQDAAVVERTRAMLLALAPGLLPCLWFQAIRQFTVGMRRPQALLQITLASIAVNAGLNWVFLHGTWGLPQLGLTGIGVATSTVYLLSCLALYLSAKKDAQLAPLLSLNAAKADGATSLRLVGLGVPIAATYGSEAGFFSLTALMAGSFGPAALAAHTAVNQLVYIVFQVAVGLSHAASINVSRELALGRTDDARRLKNTALACAAAVMTLVGIAYLSLPRVVLFPFLDSGSDQALGIATHLLMVTAVLQFFDCAQNIGVGLLRGLDDTKSGFRITLIGYWAVGLPASWLLAYALDLATLGIWLGLLTGLATTALLLLRRYNHQLAGYRSEPVPA